MPTVVKAMLTQSVVLAYWMRGSMAGLFYANGAELEAGTLGSGHEFKGRIKLSQAFFNELVERRVVVSRIVVECDEPLHTRGRGEFESVTDGAVPPPDVHLILGIAVLGVMDEQANAIANTNGLPRS